MSFNMPHLVSGLLHLSRFGTLCFPGLRKIRGLAKSPCVWGPYPTPRLGIAAPQAVSWVSGCGVGAPNPIVNLRCHPAIKNLWGRGPAQNEPFLTLQSEGPVRFEQFWDAVFSRT